jgi:hypothetical protein
LAKELIVSGHCCVRFNWREGIERLEEGITKLSC